MSSQAEKIVSRLSNCTFCIDVPPELREVPFTWPFTKQPGTLFLPAKLLFSVCVTGADGPDLRFMTDGDNHFTFEKAKATTPYSPETAARTPQTESPSGKRL